MRCFVMFVTAVGVLFLLKLKWPKNKRFYEITFEELKFLGRCSPQIRYIHVSVPGAYLHQN